jgi:N,N'-diacetyllegionaminate synthase
MRTKVLILGAGISGLTLGYELTKKKFDVHIIEKSNEVGGLIKTQLMDGVRVDSGPHLFHTAHREIVDYWRSIVGDRLKERSFYAGNYLSGKYYDYPVNRENLKEVCGREEYLRICNELDSRSENYINEGRSYFDYVRNLCGEWLSEKFFTKYPEKLWGISTKDLSARFAPKRISINNQRKAFHSGPGRFVGVIEGGCGELVEGLPRRVG